MQNGWIKLHRQIIEHPRSKNPYWGWLWIRLLILATHQEKKGLFNGKPITLKPGQLIVGRKYLACVCGTTESKVQRLLKCYAIEHQIEQQTSTTNRLITILNWDQYQGKEQQNEQQMNNERTTSEQRVNTYKKDKNIKNDKNVENNKNKNKILTSLRKDIKSEKSDPPTYGNNEINEILKELKEVIGIEDFADSRKWSRIYARHCVSLKKRIGKKEFFRRLGIMLDDNFKKQNCNKLRYVYEQIKGFIEVDTSNVTYI